MSTDDHARKKSEADTLKDAHAMFAAANADAAVKKKLTPAYLKHVETDLTAAESYLSNKSIEANAATTEGTRVKGLAASLLSVMQEIRMAVKLEDSLADVAKDFGVGADWKSSSPDALAVNAHALEKAFKAHPGVAKNAGIDAQHLHDLHHFANALVETHQHHAALVTNRKDGTAARGHAFAALAADAHHIRLAAALVHHGDPDALAHFVSPIPAHVVHHRAKASAPGAPPAPATPAPQR